MKQWIAIFTLFALLLAGCGTAAEKPETTGENPDRDRLITILDDIGQNLHPGTAGSSLTAIRITADLVSWAASTQMTKSEAASTVGDWLKGQSPEIKEAFQEQISSIASSFADIAKDGAKDALESAGVEKDLSNLGSRLKELVQAVIDAAQ